ncbi:MAG TPA: hypothetical protein P5150_00030 [Candidatus Ratteibacteria bacterium]|nr:hypothetical protein [Candidatus Ratteibacteria bacterium]
MKKNELKRKWEKEKEVYKTQEIGSGVQAFVKDILQSEDLFSLKKGLKSTPPERIKKEFLEEDQAEKIKEKCSQSPYYKLVKIQR